MYSTIIKRHTKYFTDPLPSLLIILHGKISDPKYISTRLSFCIRACISVDKNHLLSLKYIPAYYENKKGLREAVLKDMAMEKLIILKNSILGYSFNIICHNKYTEFRETIVDYMERKEFNIRYDCLILCMVYLGRYQIVDIGHKKVSQIIRHYKDIDYIKGKEVTLQDLIIEIEKIQASEIW